MPVTFLKFIVRAALVLNKFKDNASFSAEMRDEWRKILSAILIRFFSNEIHGRVGDGVIK